MALFCPVSGLIIESKPEWTDQRVSDTMTANFSVIGKSIIYSAPSGKADLPGVLASTALKERIVDEVLGTSAPYIQVQDYLNLRGSTLPARRLFSTNANEDDRLVSLIFCNLSPPMRVAVRIGNRLNSSGKNIRIARHYEDAINQSLQICDQYGINPVFLELPNAISFDRYDRSLKPVEYLTSPEWDIETPGYSNHSSIIDGCILHSISEGYLEPHHIPEIDRMRQRCASTLSNDSSIDYIVLNSTKFTGANRRARRQLMQSLVKWSRNNPIRMYIIYGTNLFMRTAVHLATPLMPFKVRVASDFVHSYNIIQKDQRTLYDDPDANLTLKNDQNQTDEDIGKLIGFIGSIDWENEGVQSGVDFEKGHPFYLLFNSIILIKEELDSLLVERAETENALRKSNNQLHSALKELEQTQEIIVQQERLAAVGQLAAGVAHDFNNILACILGSSDILQLSPGLSSSEESLLDEINGAGNRAAELVRQLLDFSRKNMHDPKHIELTEFVEETVGFYKRTMPDNIRIDVDYDAGEYVVNFDPTQLQQMIANLAINARDAMPSGGQISVTLSVVRSLADTLCVLCGELIEGSWIEIRVADSGKGIPPDVGKRIFEPFYTTKGVGNGTGLGLSQVSGIVEQNGGHLIFESSAGVGTVFSVFLPSVLGDHPRSIKGKRDSVIRGHGELVLLVEDDRRVQAVTTALLEKLDYRVITASNGEEALSVYCERRSEISLIHSDLMMPVMDGRDLFLRLNVEEPHPPMIVMSGNPLGTTGSELVQQGLADWIQKPMSLSALSQVVGRALGTVERPPG